MRTNNPITFADLRRLLKRVGFTEKRAERALIFNHPTEGLLVFRLYADDESVDARDLRTSRRFLDLRGLLEGEDFDAFVQKASTPA
jgi:hypothetical protein